MKTKKVSGVKKTKPETKISHLKQQKYYAPQNKTVEQNMDEIYDQPVINPNKP